MRRILQVASLSPRLQDRAAEILRIPPARRWPPEGLLHCGHPDDQAAPGEDQAGRNVVVDDNGVAVCRMCETGPRAA